MNAYYGPPVFRLAKDRRFGEIGLRARKAIAFVLAMIILGQWVKLAAIDLLADRIGDGAASALALVPFFAMVMFIDRRFLRQPRPETIDG